MAGIVLTVCWFWREQPVPKLDTQTDPCLKSIAEKLNTIIIPDYPTAGLTFAEAIEHLRLKSREFAPSTPRESAKGINIVIIAGGERKLPSTAGHSLRDVPLSEALRHLTGLVELKYTVERHAVAIREVLEESTPVYRKTTGLQHRMEKIILPTVQFQDATLEEAVEYLRVSRGCLDMTDGDRPAPAFNYVLHLREGVKRPPISVDLRDIPLSEALRYCAEISAAKLRYDPFAVVVTDEDIGASSVGLPVTSSAPLILPAVELAGATLAESLELIRLKSRELSPDHREINVTVMPGSSTASIDLWLKDIPISEALRYIAELSGHTLTFDGSSFVLSPRNVR